MSVRNYYKHNKAYFTVSFTQSYREGVEEDAEEEQDEEEDDEEDDEPLEAPPQDELEGLVGGGEPQEGGLWTPEGAEDDEYPYLNVFESVFSLRETH